MGKERTANVIEPFNNQSKVVRDAKANVAEILIQLSDGNVISNVSEPVSKISSLLVIEFRSKNRRVWIEGFEVPAWTRMAPEEPHTTGRSSHAHDSERRKRPTSNVNLNPTLVILNNFHHSS